jgi:DNA/RNA-binding domain of Phe-tRNA-synthetase-like protein
VIRLSPDRHSPTPGSARIAVDAHPSLAVAGFVTRFPSPLGSMPTPADVARLLDLSAGSELTRDEALRSAVRDVLRHGGYKPTGRGKPASEYLVRAAGEGTLGSINLAVDACNAVSLHSGFPISVVDLGRASGPFRIAVAPAGSSYVFNATGQEIDVGGLLCLFDGAGPCANAVRDAQRTKTGPETSETLSLLWGARGYEDRLAVAERTYRTLLDEAGAVTWPAEFTRS